MQTKAQERQSIALQLAADPEQSNRVIAGRLGVNDKLVATVRAELGAP